MRRHCLTLLELLIVISIMAMVTGIFTIQLKKAIAERRFLAEVDLIVDQLNLAQQLMLTFRSNVSVTFKKLPGDDKLFSVLEFDTPLPNRWDAELKRKKNTLTAIREIQFEEQNRLIPPDKEHVASFRFRGGGSVMSQGQIVLVHAEETLSKKIDLPGYPAPIMTSSPEQKEKYHQDRQFAEELSKQTFEEIRVPKI